jgi:hypothetical protein
MRNEFVPAFDQVAAGYGFHVTGRNFRAVALTAAQLTDSVLVGTALDPLSRAMGKSGQSQGAQRRGEKESHSDFRR